MNEDSKPRAVRPDPLTSQQRSYNMSRIRGRDTGPEWILRRALHARGLRYRLHVKSLPGTPDIVFPARRAIIFVHGCFWHGHHCPKGVTPGTNITFWRDKISRTRARDQALDSELQVRGWRTLKVWECALRGRARLNLSILIDQIEHWLVAGVPNQEIAGAWGAIDRTVANQGKAP